MEGDGQVLQVVVEGHPHPGFHRGGGVDDELPAQRHQAGFGDAQAQDNEGGDPDGVRAAAGPERLVDQHPQHLGDGQGHQAGQQGAEQAHDQPRNDRLDVRIETADGGEK